MPDIDGMDAFGAMKQQRVGKTAGRGADVQGDLAVDRDPESGRAYAPA
jgi:hypothetical protein